MSDARQRDVSSTRRSRSSRAVSPVISFDHIASNGLASPCCPRPRGKEGSSAGGCTVRGRELPQGDATQPPLEPYESAPSPFPAKTAFLTFVADKMCDDKSLTSEDLIDQCYDHFRLHDRSGHDAGRNSPTHCCNPRRGGTPAGRGVDNPSTYPASPRPPGLPRLPRHCT